MKSNLSISGHQTNSKCQWWISVWDAGQSGILLMYQTPHLHLVSFEIESLMLVFSIVWVELVFRGGAGRGQMRPHLDRPHTPPILTPVVWDAPHSSAAIKGRLPTSAPWVGCQLEEFLALLPTKGGDSREVLNHSTTRGSQGSHLSHTLHCLSLWFLFRFRLILMC